MAKYLFVLIAVYNSSCSRTGPAFNLINAIGGVNLRAEPSITAKQLGILPDGDIVTVDLTILPKDDLIDGFKGKWIFVKTANQSGWIFSRFVTNFSVQKSCLMMQAKVEGQLGVPNHLVCGKDRERLLLNAQWFGRRNLEDSMRRNPEKVRQALRNLPEATKIEDHQGNLALVTTIVPTEDPDSFIRTNTIWLFKDNFWQLVIIGKRDSLAKILRINSDEIVDVVESSGCCDWRRVTVLFGETDGSLKKVFEKAFPISGSPNFELKIGSCAELSIRGQEISGGVDAAYPPRHYSFDCGKNQFVENWREK